jgi:hypothetical protein
MRYPQHLHDDLTLVIVLLLQVFLEFFQFLLISVLVLLLGCLLDFFLLVPTLFLRPLLGLFIVIIFFNLAFLLIFTGLLLLIFLLGLLLFLDSRALLFQQLRSHLFCLLLLLIRLLLFLNRKACTFYLASRASASRSIMAYSSSSTLYEPTLSIPTGFSYSPSSA